ncbi:syntaxin-like protein psy1 [Favolaschia claudopus]|uniref:Syntaxin-like protein psy1 n=1 Tax=Favolaschia claudopus TaxID=2862362 RepID=A0AAW0E254_9AGAR
MATDRMAAFRAQRQANHEQPTHQTHELTNVNGNGGGADGAPLTERDGFLAEVTSIQESIDAFNANVTRISTLNARSLDALGDDGDVVKQELDELVRTTMALSMQLRDRIKQLQASVVPGTQGKQEREIRQNRVQHVRTKFTEGLQTYQRVEQDYRAKSRTRVERQYRIVKPDATPEEINAVVSGGGDQVFMQALTTSSSYANARSAYNEVQSRSQDLRRMEETLEQLAQLFRDMAFLVEQQDETVAAIETGAIDVEKNAKEAEQEVSRAVRIARALRKKRWICFFIVLVIVIILAAVLAVELTKNNNHNSNNNNNNSGNSTSSG